MKCGVPVCSLFLLGAADHRELRDVLVHKVQRDGVGSFALGVSIDDTHPDAGFNVIVGDLNVSCDDVPPSVVFHDGSGFAGLSTCERPMNCQHFQNKKRFDVFRDKMCVS